MPLTFHGNIMSFLKGDELDEMVAVVIAIFPFAQSLTVYRNTAALNP